MTTETKTRNYRHTYVLLQPTVRDKLAEVAKKEKRSVSMTIAIAVDEYLAKRESHETDSIR